MKTISQKQLLKISFILSLVLLLTTFILYSIEYIFGNGDGIWFDRDIRHLAFQFLLFFHLIVAASYILLYGPHYLRGFIFSTFVFLSLLWMIEKGCLWYKKYREASHPKNSSFSQPFLRPDWTDSFVLNDTLGVSAKKNWRIDWIPYKDGVSYDTVHISTDSMGRRTTINPYSDSQDKYALFFGCSYTYGDGVSDQETMPSYFQSLSPTTQVYNYGFLAYSPLHMLARLQHTHLPSTIKQKKGVAFFSLINDHVDRVIPSTRWIELTLGRFPYLDKSTMTTNGSFQNEKRVFTDFVLNFQHTGIKSVLNWGYPKKHTQEHRQLLVHIIEKSKEEFKKQFANDEFYVIIFPGNPVTEEVKQMFKDKAIKFLDYSSLIAIEDKMLPFDTAHPSPIIYETIAKQLKVDFPDF